MEEVFEVHKRRRKYYILRLGSLSDSPGTLNHPLDVLRDLINDGGLLIYPKRMIIGALSTIDETPNLAEQELEIRKILAECRYLSRSNSGHEKQRWYTLIMIEKFPTAITALLLSLLPNIRAIELRDHDRNFFIPTMVEKICCASRLNQITRVPSTEEQGNREEDTWYRDKPHALSNLTEFSICSTQGAYQRFEDVVGWAWLPSLRSVQCKGLHSVKDPQQRGAFPGGFQIPGHQSEIISLELEECMVCEEDFQILLKFTKALKNFRYQYGVPDNAEGCVRGARLDTELWNPRALVETLSTYASHSLVTLDLTRTGLPQSVHGDRLAGRIFVGSLRRFHVLRKLRADVVIFVESTLENLITRYAPTYKEDSHEEIVKKIKELGKPLTDQPRPLVDLLPASLEELALCLIRESTTWKPEDLFMKAPVLKAERLPHLNKIVLEGAIKISEETARAWQDAGVQIHNQIPFQVLER